MNAIPDYGRMEDFVMIAAKKIKLLGGLIILSSAITLASCDTFYALPNNYNDAILNNEDGQATDVYNNIFSEIYDAIALGKTDRILDEFMYVVAKDQFGEYSSLKEIIDNGSDTATLAAYAKSHASIFITDDDSYLLERAQYDITVDQLLAQRVKNFYNRIQERINEYFYTQISSGSYSDRSKFYEERLARKYYADLYKIDMNHDDWYVGYLTPSFTEDDVSEFIHFEYFEDYINRALIPDIYRELLVEQYLYETNYSALGRAYARDVDIINLTSDTAYTQDGINLSVAANQLLDTFADIYILNQTDPNAPVDFEIAANAWRGIGGMDSDGNVIPLTDAEEALLEQTGFTSKTVIIDGASVTYYPVTQYGILLDEYLLIDESNRFASDEAEEALATFTNNNAYPKEVGLQIKTAELALKDYTTDGWYVKNDGLTSLPDSIRTRLFNISVSTEIDNFAESEMETAGHHDYDPDNYVRYINNNYYLTPAVSEVSSVDSRNFVMYADGSSYIVKVNEAVSTSKLSIENEHGYYALRPDNVLFTEETAFDVAHVLGTRDAYINSANEKYIEEYCVYYHDSTIYEYFKSTFPDLFEDD